MTDFGYPLTERARAVLGAAEQAAAEGGKRYVGTEDLLLGLLRTDCAATDILIKHEISEERIGDLVGRLISIDSAQTPPAADGAVRWTPKARDVIVLARSIADRGGQKQIGTEHLLMALLSQEDSICMRLLRTAGASDESILREIYQSMGEEGLVYLEAAQEAQPAPGEERYTGKLADFSRDLTAMAAAGTLGTVIGRTEELARLIRTLSRKTKNNPCLIGEPGVGKTAIVEKLAAEIAAGNVPDAVRGKRVLALDLAGMVAGTKYRGEFEERIQGVVREASEAGDILLFIDELHTLIGAGGAEGALDAANILKPALSRGELQVIGATTVDEYRKHIEKDAALERRFQPIMIEEPSEEQTVEILYGLRGEYERHHGVKITDGALLAAAQLSARYISDRFLPDKAIDLLDETAAKVRLTGAKTGRELSDAARERRRLTAEMERAVLHREFAALSALREETDRLERETLEKHTAKRRGAAPRVTENDVAGVISDWTKIPASKLTEGESARLRNLEKLLHKRIVSQDEAVSAVAKAVRRGRVGLKDPRRPVGSFLCLGPTGVGQTELARALAEALFGREEAMIRVDMSEYMEQHSVSKIIGSPPGYVGYDDAGQLTEKIRRHPYSVVLFDEIEKAHPDVMNILLQILDDGRITDAHGKTVNFENTILVMTTNAGSQMTTAPVGFSDNPELQSAERTSRALSEFLRPEFINRVDEIITFRQLTPENFVQIASLMLSDLQKTLDDKGIRMTFTPAAAELIARESYSVKFGARNMRRYIQTHVEDVIATDMVAKRGDVSAVSVDADGNELKILSL